MVQRLNTLRDYETKITGNDKNVHFKEDYVYYIICTVDRQRL